MTTTTGPTAIDLTADQLELQQRAREFVEQVLMPLEQTAEGAHGRLPEETIEAIKRAAIAARLHGGRFPVALGGQGWSVFDRFLVHEQLGRVTNGSAWHMAGVYNVFEGHP